METENQFGTLPMGKLITKMSVPVIASMLVQALYNVVDSLFVAQLGMKPLTALGLAYPIQIIMIAISNGIGVGMNALVSQRMGAGDMRGAGKATGNAITLGLVCTALAMLFGIFGAKPFFTISTSDAEIAAYGLQYLSVCCILSFGLFFSIIGQRMLQAAGESTWSMVVHLMGCVFNVIFDPIMIFGLFGCPAMGVTGAALATVGGQIFSAVAAFVVCGVKKKGVQYGLSDLKPSKDLGIMCKVGTPAALAMGIASVMSFGMNQILKAETLGLAVFTVFYKLWCFVIMPCNGLIQGTVPVMGYNYGAHNKERLRSGIKLTIIIGVVMMAVVTVIFQFFAGTLVSFFDNGNNGPDFVPACVNALHIISWIFVFFGFGQVSSGIFQGMGNGTPSLIFALLHQCILLLPAAWLFLRLGGLNALWYSFWVAEILSAAIMVFLFRRCYRSVMDTQETLPSEQGSSKALYTE